MSVTAAQGFVAAGIHAGIKPSGDPDLSLVATDDGRAVPSAGVFTSNLLTAPPVLTSRAHLDATGGRSAAVILNSGNANAATGDPGLVAAEAMCAMTAAEIGCAADEVLVCSTGLIGIPFPTETVVAGVAPLAAARSVDGGVDAAEAIRTTDTYRKETVVEAPGFTLGGMAKGAAMLAPNMATMLAVLTTDAELNSDELASALKTAVAHSFNRLSVDGCTSTNDTVLVFASGKRGRPDVGEFTDALSAACLDLASQMAMDAEGATKFVQVVVNGAASDEDAEQAARRVADSLLVKCSWYGGKAYWGRVASELGSSGAAFDQTKVSVAYGGTVVCAGGVAAEHDVAEVEAHMAGKAIEVLCDLGLGDGEATILTNDLTHGYVDENMGDS
jgi:glutamate N-acetyltransferase / amino-acid N-acetyltransferase